MIKVALDHALEAEKDLEVDHEAAEETAAEDPDLRTKNDPKVQNGADRDLTLDHGLLNFIFI